jgi:hypothetical protein
MVTIAVPSFTNTALAAEIRQPVISLNPEFKSLQLGESQIVDVVVDSGDYALSTFAIKVIYTPNAVYQGFTSQGAAFDTTITNPTELGNSVSFARSQSNGSFKGSGIVMRLQFKPNMVDTMHLYIDQAASEVYDTKGHSVLWKVNEGFFSVIHVDPVSLPTAQPLPTYRADVPVYRGDHTPADLSSFGISTVSSSTTSNTSRFIVWGMILSGLIAVGTYILYMRKTFSW